MPQLLCSGSLPLLHYQVRRNLCHSRSSMNNMCSTFLHVGDAALIASTKYVQQAEAMRQKYTYSTQCIQSHLRTIGHPMSLEYCSNAIYKGLSARMGKITQVFPPLPSFFWLDSPQTAEEKVFLSLHLIRQSSNNLHKAAEVTLISTT